MWQIDEEFLKAIKEYWDDIIRKDRERNQRQAIGKTMEFFVSIEEYDLKFFIQSRVNKCENLSYNSETNNYSLEDRRNLIFHSKNITNL